MEQFIRYGGLPPKYRCDVEKNWTYEEWLRQGEVHTALGIVTLIYGIVGVILYIPCCIALLHRDLWSISAYKILFLVSILQIINLSVNSVMAGIWFIMGVVFCNYPYISYLTGITSMLSWSGVCCTCFFLELSRVIDLLNPKWHDVIFGGSRVYISFLLIFIYMMSFLFFSKPPVFNSRHMTLLFDPLVYPDGSHFNEYASYLQVLNNVGTVSLTVILTVVFAVVFLLKSTFYQFKLTLPQKQIFFQSLISSTNTFISASIYVSYSFIEGGVVLNYLGLITWQLSTCAELIMFLFVNRTVRTQVLRILHINRGAVGEGSQVFFKVFSVSS